MKVQDEDQECASAIVGQVPSPRGRDTLSHSTGPNSRTGYEEITGNTPDISEWLDFDFWDMVWWLEEKKPGMDNANARLGRWAGI